MQTESSLTRRYQTKQKFVYETLRNGIMRGQLAPGERLRTEEIAQRLGVSPIPVREALQLLQSERLIEMIPHVGARVAHISHDSIVEVFTVMEGLELVATRTAAQRMSATDLQKLNKLLSQMDRVLERQSYDEWGDLNTAFHRLIASVTEMPMLLEMTQRTLDQWDRVRHYYLKGVLTQRLEQAQREHRQIVEAMRDKDFPALEQLVRVHNQGALAAYREYLAGNISSAS